MPSGRSEEEVVRRLRSARPPVHFDPLDGASIRQLAANRHRYRTRLVVSVVAVPVAAAVLVVALTVLAVGTGRTSTPTPPTRSVALADCVTGQLRLGAVTTWEDQTTGNEFIDLRVGTAGGGSCRLPASPYQVRLQAPSSALLVSHGPATEGRTLALGGDRGSAMVVLTWRPPCLDISTVLHVAVTFSPGANALSASVPVDNPSGLCPVARNLPSFLAVQALRHVSG